MKFIYRFEYFLLFSTSKFTRVCESIIDNFEFFAIDTILNRHLLCQHWMNFIRIRENVVKLRHRDLFNFLRDVIYYYLLIYYISLFFIYITHQIFIDLIIKKIIHIITFSKMRSQFFNHDHLRSFFFNFVFTIISLIKLLLI